LNLFYQVGVFVEKISVFVLIVLILCVIFISGCELVDEKGEYHPLNQPGYAADFDWDPDNISDDDTSLDDDALNDDDSVDDDDSTDDDDTGALDPNDDEDKDGVLNGEEEKDGTDPYDPSDALKWHPEITGYPRLLADSSRWEEVRFHYQSGDQDYNRLISRVRQWAEMTPLRQEPGIYEFQFLEHNSQIANAAAFMAFIDNDGSLALKAYSITVNSKVILANLPLDDCFQGTIHGGQALVEFCHTYDILAGFELLLPSELDDMRDSILGIAEKLHGFYIRLFLGKLLQNNHIIKFTSGLGVVGMTFNDIPQAAKYVNVALTTAPWCLLDFQMPDGGGQGEGPNYLDYTFKTYLPFVAAYHRFAKGQSYPYKIECRARLWPPCVSEVIEVDDPWSDIRMKELLDWRLAIIMPDGKCPPIDDSNLSCGPSGPIAALFGRDDYAWHYRQSQSCSQNTSAGAAILELAYLDTMPSPSPPAIDPSIIMENGGQGILREDWSPDSMYALVVGEHGKARLAGLGHEQADATSFIFYGKRQMLALDSGYISFKERWNVIHGKNHNLILVDDMGPPLGVVYAFTDSDAYLSEFINAPPFRSIKVDSAYRGAEIERRVALIDDDYFVTWETVSSDHPRTYTWQLQANAGGTTSGFFSLFTDGALIERTNGAMRVYLQSDALLAFREDLETHGFSHSQFEKHSVLRAEASGATARFLGVHPVADDTLSLPVVTDYPSLQELVYVIEGEGYTDILIFSEQGGFIVGPVENYSHTVESDGEFAWVRIDIISQTVTGHQIGGSYLKHNNINL